MSDPKPSRFSHETVLLHETVHGVLGEEPPKKDDVFLDLTFGGGGHSKLLLQMHPEIKLVVFDQDSDALNASMDWLKENNITFYHSNFERAAYLLDKDFPGLEIRGVMADLGVSSHQFDVPDRGFSFRHNGPLDMRMDTSSDLTAAKILNEYPEEELARILYDYGEERLSRRIAKAILEKREASPFSVTKELEDLVYHCYPKKSRFGKTHPATRSFQALRIAVNNELGVLDSAIPDLFDRLKTGGRMGFISFHSLEDRIVKRWFKHYHQAKTAKAITKKPLIPSDEEIKRNSRSRSAKLRILERGDYAYQKNGKNRKYSKSF